MKKSFRTLLFYLLKSCLIFAFFLLTERGFAQQNKMDETEKGEVFTIVEKMPAWRGCESFPEEEQYDCTIKKLTEFISRNIIYPYKARENGIEGRVILTFVINNYGEVTRLKVLRGIGAGCDEEALRVVKLTNSYWIPGEQKGENVSVQFNLPLNFRLPQDTLKNKK